MQDNQRDVKVTNTQMITGRVIVLTGVHNPTVLYRERVFTGTVHDDRIVKPHTKTGLTYTGGCCDCANTTPVTSCQPQLSVQFICVIV